MKKPPRPILDLDGNERYFVEKSCLSSNIEEGVTVSRKVDWL